MGRSRLPLPSLLVLFGALLLPSPELLMEIPDGVYDVSVIYPKVQKVVAFAVEQFNQDQDDNTNYFKDLRVLKAQIEVSNGKLREYHLKVELMKTACKKKGRRLTYTKIKQCSYILGNRERPTCYFEVIPGSKRKKMNLKTTVCV